MKILRDYLENNNLLCKENDENCCQYCKGFYDLYNKFAKDIKTEK